MYPCWTDITDACFRAEYGSRQLQEHIKDIAGVKLHSIDDEESDTVDDGVRVHLEGGQSFSMGHFKTQCGWLATGDYTGIKSSDFKTIGHVAFELARLCTYGGVYVSAPPTKTAKVALEKLGYSCIFKNGNGGVYHKCTGVDMEEDYDEEWDEYDDY